MPPLLSKPYLWAGWLPAAALLLAPAVARAEVTPSVGAAGALMVDDGVTDSVSGGFGVKGFIGYSPELYPLLLVPELGVSQHFFGDLYGRRTTRLLGGVRLGVTAAVEPSLSLHLGYGFSDGQDGDAILDRNGFTYDVAAGVDWRLERWFTIGPRLTYCGLIAQTGSGAEGAHWLDLGLNATFWL